MTTKGKETLVEVKEEPRATTPPKMQLDPATMQMFEAMRLFLQQQQAEEKKESKATEALRTVVGNLDQFDGKDISKFLRMYKKQMEMYRVPDGEMIRTFELAVILELKGDVRGLMSQARSDWEQFARLMREHYFSEDSERVTKKLFLEVELPDKELFATALLKEFDNKFSLLTRVEMMMLEDSKTELFLKAADLELQEKLEMRLEDSQAEGGLTTDWRRVQDAVELLENLKQRKEKGMIRHIMKGMRDLSIKLTRLEEKSSGDSAPKPAPRQGWVQRCIWCDAPEHARRDCEDFQANLRQGAVFWKEGKIALRDTGEFLQTKFGKGGMKKIFEEFQAAHAVTAVEAASYGARASDVGERDTSEGYVELRANTRPWWKKRDEGRIPEKGRLQRGKPGSEKSCQEPLPPDTVMDEAQKQAEKGKGPMKEKAKGPSYKLQSDIEASTDLKAIFEEQILNSKVEFTLRQILGIAKREFHDVIIDAIKRKRHMTGELDQVTSHVIDSVVSKEEEKEIANCCQQNSEREKHVRFLDEVVEENIVNPSRFSRNHWARATREALVKLENLEEPVVALIDHGSEINLVSKSVYEKGKWHIDTKHNWMISVANSSFGKLFGACPGIKVKIGDVVAEQNMFVQDTTSYPMVLGQPFITAVRMETKVMDDGSAYARIQRFEECLESGLAVHRSLKDLPVWERKRLKKMQKELVLCGVLDSDEKIEGVYEELGWDDSLSELAKIGGGDEDKVVQIHSRELYSLVETFRAPEVLVETKYKTVAKKVKPVAASLPEDARKQTEQASKERSLRDAKKVGHQFTEATLDALKIGVDGSLLPSERLQFREMLKNHGKAFAFKHAEIGCVDPNVVTPMIIFTMPHIPWDLRPIPVPRAHLPKLIELLKEKMEAFAGRAVYSMGDLYSGYDQFQLAEGSRDVTTMKTPLGLLRMCTLPQGATNSVAHMMNGMNKVLRDFIPEKTMPFLDNVPIKGCREDEKDETLDSRGCRRYVSEHIEDCEKILKRLDEMNLTLSGAKSTFGVREVVIVGHLCGWFGKKPEATKIEAIQRIWEVCKSLSKVRKFLGSCVFYHIWIPHYAHIAGPLYALSRKGQKFRWEEKHVDAMRKLKALLSSPPVLGRVDYKCGRPVILTVDTSPIAIGWAVGQDDENGNRIAVRFGARVFSSRQREYPQVKRKLWGVVTAMKAERNYLIGAMVVVEIDCLLLLGMITNCSTPDMIMLNWVAYIKFVNPEFKHIVGKENAVADMLLRARYDNEEEMVEESEDIGENFYSITEVGVNSVVGFREDLYEGEWLNIGCYLETLSKQEGWTDEEFRRIRKKAYNFRLEGGYLWKRPKRRTGMPLRVVCDRETQLKLMAEFHESLWAGH
ncbi:hypothetical protein R1sor_000702 [Riccia sorocarpa]|uniref:Reverse transcriptase/retrotransposon-derived protein RNase H-like domain-containing protein n=1 Tax=Riccia sorocarpa TaxID=122646 RepID=A0ABD3GTV3_9MARC